MLKFCHTSLKSRASHHGMQHLCSATLEQVSLAGRQDRMVQEKNILQGQRTPGLVCALCMTERLLAFQILHFVVYQMGVISTGKASEI